MGCLNLTLPKCQSWYILLILVSIQGKALCSIYKVGDLDAWAIPTSNPQLYTKWSKTHNIKIGDSLFFLYPPSQDSVIQVTEEGYNRCNIKDPILYMSNGNSLFNISRAGDYYFTSGAEGNCAKSQKLHISVNGNGSSTAAAAADSPAFAPSYSNVFGSIPIQASASSLLKIPVFLSVAAAGIFIHLIAV